MELIVGDGLVPSRIQTAGTSGAGDHKGRAGDHKGRAGDHKGRAGDHKGRPYGNPPACRAANGGRP
ncbi:MAG: hypothetical protein F4029_09615 [Gammaproteobacteria bacterium]|nr:hypothetical protein [Gammaproteobacteria bacterium]MYF30852.1 hypothetical protein [Gammaproteobacteria bacterium]MYK46475.1 hypothetical protein [Gammaproteobacteria bacterium]